jgi:hypothetical protein
MTTTAHNYRGISYLSTTPAATTPTAAPAAVTPATPAAALVTILVVPLVTIPTKPEHIRDLHLCPTLIVSMNFILQEDAERALC